tara:strand:+ start:1704 stop:1874 length:171 start_codon:yes stop_codon:yes gene_type:complete
MTLEPQCFNCKHLLSGLKCKAFKKIIPNEILEGIHDHTKPFKGDNGIQFESIDSPQ